MQDQEHTRLLDHPVVHAYAALRAFGATANHCQAAIAELRDRTRPGDHVLVLGAARADKIEAIARALPDRCLLVVDCDAQRRAELSAQAQRHQLDNLRCEDHDLERPGFDPGRFRVALSMHGIHRVRELERLWRGVHSALLPHGSVLAQEYVGAPDFVWTAAQVQAADAALRELVPPRLKLHHDRVGAGLAAELQATARAHAPRSDEVVTTCEAAGFKITGSAVCGGGLLTPVLVGQVAAFDPRDWGHNLVLGRLFEREHQLERAGVLGSALGMFVAQRNS